MWLLFDLNIFLGDSSRVTNPLVETDTNMDTFTFSFNINFRSN